MNKKTRGLLLIIIGTLCGVVALFAYQAKIQSVTEYVPVVKAKEEISPFTAVKREQVMIEEVPKGAVPAQAFSKLEDVVGKHMRGVVPKDTMIVSDFVATAEKDGLSPLFSQPTTDPKKRVIALEGSFLVDVKNISPGDYLDVIGTVKGKDKITSYVTANKAKVIKVSEKENAAQKGYVVLEMTMEEARMTDMIQRVGNIEYLLRPYESEDGNLQPKVLQMDLVQENPISWQKEASINVQ